MPGAGVEPASLLGRKILLTTIAFATKSCFQAPFLGDQLSTASRVDTFSCLWSGLYLLHIITNLGGAYIVSARVSFILGAYISQIAPVTYKSLRFQCFDWLFLYFKLKATITHFTCGYDFT